MVFAHSELRDRDPVSITAVKILIAGGFGVGKTTLVSTISEVVPLRTEEVISELSIGVDDLSGVESKTTTTVAFDFGRITLTPQCVLYLFGTPGQDRFWFLWDELSRGSLGAVVLVDTRRLGDSFAAVDYFESRRIPFALAVNCFDAAARYSVEEVRAALDLGPDTPIALCDARHRESVKNVLLTLMEYVLARANRLVEMRPGHLSGG
ncbi:GTP-binding protein [Nocardia harenae]|uniref:GTP-binding protein n=1 Tax=Nocardia harenae TaxID=358707 RepID=UPI00082B6EC7|nr:ATP/GTP-binding protein [Nocardia harenae]